MSKHSREKQSAAPRVPTTEKLAKALEQANAPASMIAAARAGHYDDYKSDVPDPIRQLVRDARDANLPTIVIAAINGKFDGQKWEADEWAKSPEGRATFQQFLKRF